MEYCALIGLIAASIEDGTSVKMQMPPSQEEQQVVEQNEAIPTTASMGTPTITTATTIQYNYKEH